MTRARAGWTTVLVVVVTAPLVLYALAAPGLDPTTSLADGAGILATSLLVCAATPLSRIPSLTGTLGIDAVLRLHKRLGIGALAATLAHLGFLVAHNPATLALLDPANGSPASRAALTSTVALLGLGASQRLRKRRYELWWWSHVVLAAAAVGAAGLHVFWLDHLIARLTFAAWFVVLSGCLTVALGYRWVWRRRHQRFTVAEVRHLTGAATLVLRPKRGRHRPGAPRTSAFQPGQFAWLRTTRFGHEHPYSLSGSASSDRLEFTVRRGLDFADELSASWPGRAVWVDGPHGAFTVADDAPGTVMIAAGVGMAPIMSMLRTLADTGDTRPHRLVQAAGDPAGLLFGPELESLGARMHLDVLRTVRRPTPSWWGRIGPVNAALLRGFLPGSPLLERQQFIVCGPPALIDDACAALRRLRVPDHHVHTERFDSPPQRRTTGAHSLPAPDKARARRGPGAGHSRSAGRPRSGLDPSPTRLDLDLGEVLDFGPPRIQRRTARHRSGE